MPTVRIDDAAIERMQPGETLWDTETRGFGIRFRARDKVYCVKARVRGRQAILTIGRHGAPKVEGKVGGVRWTPTAARNEAKRLLGIIKDGQDPAAARAVEKAALMFGDLADRYIEEHAKRHKKPRTIAEDERLLALHIKPALEHLKARDITKADVQRFHAKMHGSPVAANRALATLSAIMSWAEAVGERPDHSNPCRHVHRFPEKARERLLTVPELGRLGDALDRTAVAWTDDSKAEWRTGVTSQAEALHVPEIKREAWIEARMPRRDTAEDWRAIAAIKLLIFTGARLSEILGLQWAWIDATIGVARLPDSKTGAKNLYLPPGALAVLADLTRMEGNPHVLPGDRIGSQFVGIQKPWQRIRALAALPDVRIHDLRHAFASAAVAAGDSLFIVGKLLGHRQSSTTERYAHLAPDPALAVAARTADRLADAMNAGRRPAPDNVFQHPAVKAAG